MKNRVFAVVFILALSLLAGVLLPFILASAIPFAAASSVFYRTYGGTEMKLSKAYDVVQTGDGGYALTGGSDAWLIKTDSTGNIAWNKTYGYGSANAVIQTSDTGYALSGYNSEQGYPTFCLVKTDDTSIIPEIPQSLIAPLVIAATLTTIAAAAATRNKTKLHTPH